MAHFANRNALLMEELLQTQFTCTHMAHAMSASEIVKRKKKKTFHALRVLVDR